MLCPQALNEHQQNILRVLQQQRLAEMMAGANPNAELLQRQQAMQAQQLQQQRLQQLHAQQVRPRAGVPLAREGRCWKQP